MAEQKSLSQYLRNSSEQATTNESLIAMLVIGYITYSVANGVWDSPIAKSIFGLFKSGAKAAVKGAKAVGKKIKDRKEKKAAEKEKKAAEKETSEKAKGVQAMLAIGNKEVNKLPDGKEKDQAKNQLDTISKNSVNLDGTPKEPEEIQKALPADFKKDIKKPDEKEMEKAGKELESSISKMSPEERDKLAEEGTANSNKAAGNKPEDNKEDVEGSKEQEDKKEKNDKDKAEKTDKEEDNKEEKNDKEEIVKDEEVTDPETGKKIKVKTHTGPRGGKYYWPDGKPKTPENKVYVESSLSEFMMNNH